MRDTSHTEPWHQINHSFKKKNRKSRLNGDFDYDAPTVPFLLGSTVEVDTICCQKHVIAFSKYI